MSEKLDLAETSFPRTLITFFVVLSFLLAHEHLVFCLHGHKKGEIPECLWDHCYSLSVHEIIPKLILHTQQYKTYEQGAGERETFSIGDLSWSVYNWATKQSSPFILIARVIVVNVERFERVLIMRKGFFLTLLALLFPGERL